MTICVTGFIQTWQFLQAGLCVIATWASPPCMTLFMYVPGRTTWGQFCVELVCGVSVLINASWLSEHKTLISFFGFDILYCNLFLALFVLK